jgi:hypothetical protein
VLSVNLIGDALRDALDPKMAKSCSPDKSNTVKFQFPN